jgi:hypothetical protein
MESLAFPYAVVSATTLINYWYTAQYALQAARLRKPALSDVDMHRCVAQRVYMYTIASSLTYMFT